MVKHRKLHHNISPDEAAMRMTCAHDVHAPVLARVYESFKVKPKINFPLCTCPLPDFGHPMFTGGQTFSKKCIKLTLFLPSKNSILHLSTATRSSGSL